MKVILKSYVDSLGDAGDIVDVANGYANNFLIPQNLAMRATKGAVADSEALMRARVKREAVEIGQATEVAKGLSGRVLVIEATAGEDGTLYGSVGKRDVADALLSTTGIEVDSKKIDLPRPIKTVGQHEVGVRLHREVTAMVTVDVVADQVMASGAEDLEEALAEGAPEPQVYPTAAEADDEDEDETAEV